MLGSWWLCNVKWYAIETCNCNLAKKSRRPRGPMDKASAYGAGDCRFKCWAYVKPRTACSFLAFTRSNRNTPFVDHVGTMLGVYGAYVGPIVLHVRLLEAMLGPSWSHVELMLSQERRAPSSFYPPQKEHVVFGSCWDHVSVYGAYVGPMLIHVLPMLIHVRLLVAM